MAYWLMKSEPDEYSIDDLLRDKKSAWFGVRNYQARNFMRDDMKIGEGVLFYHSSCPQPGIAGIAKVASKPMPDKTQFEPGDYFESKSTVEKPIWMCVEVAAVKKIPLLSLATIRATPELESMRILQRGNRLSITPITDEEWNFIHQHFVK
ncbi:MAG: EVE domain-containing protein [Betaproteobacteria bacterium]|nr:MAG: EVE domain-containing protein [Betaproteobacteria bacterium]